MNEISPDWIQIIEKYLSGDATKEEVDAVDAWYQAFEEQPGLTDNLTNQEIDMAIKSSLRKLQQRMD